MPAGDRLVPFRVYAPGFRSSAIADLAAPYLGMADWYYFSSANAVKAYPTDETKLFREGPLNINSDPRAIMEADNRFWRTAPWGLYVKDVYPAIYEIDVASDVLEPYVRKMRDQLELLFDFESGRLGELIQPRLLRPLRRA